jgi:UDP-galactopyranose mutase
MTTERHWSTGDVRPVTRRYPGALTRVLIVGAGLTGCTVAHRLAQDGVRSVLLERADVPGGLIRSEHMSGVLYEPHGSHVFHTEDREVWELANRMTPFRPYRHRVDIVVEGRILNWPILISDIDAQSCRRTGR